MALNIKNERVSRLAQELAELSGESITVAVGRAIERRLTELRRKGLAGRLMAIGRKCAAQAPADWRTRDFDHELYDERGLPR
jgi:hypothetical protein